MKLALSLAVLRVGSFVLAGVASAAASPSRCIDCHTAIPSSPNVASHLAEWHESAHGANGVGCESCHGGDPSVTEPRQAHRGVLHSSRPNSPVNKANLFRTCSPCHAAQAGAFASSLHRVLLDADDLRAPSCSTCHGSMAVRVQTSEALEALCADCHPAGSPRAAYPGLARAGVEEIARRRAALASLSPHVKAVSDSERRRDLRTKWDAANRAASDAVTAFHAFDLGRMDAALDVARREADGVARELGR
jgi:cytochrome c554/c'-like protein